MSLTAGRRRGGEGGGCGEAGRANSYQLISNKRAGKAAAAATKRRRRRNGLDETGARAAAETSRY